MLNAKLFVENCQLERPGIWAFAPNDGVFVEGKAAKGFGFIKYDEGSVYVGDIFYNGRDFHKLGHGRQDFTKSSLGNVITSIGERKACFIGSYDYTKTDWIYGNGVLYYTDRDGKPTHFRKGFFSGLQKIGDYTDTFDENILLSEYTADMEFEFDERTDWWQTRLKEISEQATGYPTADTMLIGDSYFELGDQPEFAGRNLFREKLTPFVINAGVGGSTYQEWQPWIEYLPHELPIKTIIINLGFNDIHASMPLYQIAIYREQMLIKLQNMYPKASIYMFEVTHAPIGVPYRQTEKEYNLLIRREMGCKGVTVLQWNDKIEESRDNCFHEDMVHPNEKGYELFVQAMKENIAIMNRNELNVNGAKMIHETA